MSLAKYLQVRQGMRDMVTNERIDKLKGRLARGKDRLLRHSLKRHDKPKRHRAILVLLTPAPKEHLREQHF